MRLQQDDTWIVLLMIFLRLHSNQARGGTCPDGYFTDHFDAHDDPNYGSSACQPVGPGYYSQSNVRFPCPVGTYSNRLVANSCQPCPLGTFSSQEASKACTLCPSGSYAPLTASTTCLPCDPTYYAGEGSDYGYTSNGMATDVVYCVAPLYPSRQDDDDDDANNNDDHTMTVHPSSSTIPSPTPSPSHSSFSFQSSQPSMIPTIAIATRSPSSQPDVFPSLPPSLSPTPIGTTIQQHHSDSFDYPWRRNNDTLFKGNHNESKSQGRPWRVTFHGNFRNDSTPTDLHAEEDDASSMQSSLSLRLRPYLPLLVLGVAMALLAFILCWRLYQQQEQGRKQIVTKTYSQPKRPPPPRGSSTTKPSCTRVSLNDSSRTVVMKMGGIQQGCDEDDEDATKMPTRHHRDGEAEDDTTEGTALHV